MDLREAGEGVIKIQPLVLPEGMSPSSTEVISCLNEYLTQAIQVPRFYLVYGVMYCVMYYMVWYVYGES